MTVGEYERLVTAGVLDDPRVELIDGYLVRKMGKNPPHIWAVDAIIEALKATVPGGWIRKEDPVRIPNFDEPEPDAAVVRESRDDYRGRIPGFGNIALLVEVAESTLDREQGEKRRAYAKGVSCITGSSTWSTAMRRSTPTLFRAMIGRASF
jgi:Uma2 family endonuclease